MPFYEYSCGCGRTSVERKGYDASTIPCACGAAMKRAEFNCPELIGETVPKYGAKPGGAGIKDKHGRWRLDLLNEAQQELAHHGVTDGFRQGLAQAKRMGATIRE